MGVVGSVGGVEVRQAGVAIDLICDVSGDLGAVVGCVENEAAGIVEAVARKGEVENARDVGEHSPGRDFERGSSGEDGVDKDAFRVVIELGDAGGRAGDGSVAYIDA